MRRGLLATCSALTLAATPASAYTFLLDFLEIVHSGGTTFLDEFDDGAPPPSVGYGVQGTMGPEAGDLLTLDVSGAVPSTLPGFDNQVAVQVVNASLLQDFSVAARFDLVLPDPLQIEGQAAILAYVVPLLEVHTVIAAFQSTDTLPLALSLSDFNTDTSVLTLLDVVDVSSLITGSIDQVEVRLDVPAGTNLAEASLVVYDGGVAMGSATVPTLAPLVGTVLPSAGFQVFVPEPSGALLPGAAAVVALARRRRRQR